MKTKSDRRLDRLERTLGKLLDEVAILRRSKSNPQREKLEKRVFDLENKFFAFQCGAQAQVERDRVAIRDALAKAEHQKAEEET